MAGWLVVDLPTPLKNHEVKVSWDDDSIPNWMESHKIPWFQTTNQFISTIYQWPFQDPRLEVPTIYKAFFKASISGNIPTIHMAWNMVLTYLHQLDPGIPIDPFGYLSVILW